MYRRLLFGLLLVFGLATTSADAGDGRVVGGAISGGLSLGLPLGIPPAPNNETLLAVPPDDTAVFIHWSATKSPDRLSSNRTEQLLGQREIQEFIEYVKTSIHSTAKASGDNVAIQAIVMSATQSIEALLTHETAVYVRFDGSPCGGLVCDLGESAETVKPMLVGLIQSLGNDVKVSEHQDGRVYSIEKAPVPPLQLTFRGRLLILGVGDGEFQAIAERLQQSKPSDWLVNARKRSSVQRIASVAYVNAERFDDFIDDLGVPEELEALGASGVRAMTCVTGMSDDAITIRSWFDVDPAMKQRLSALVSSEITQADISDISLDAPIMAAVKLDFGAVMTEFLNSLDVIEPGAAQELQRDFSEEFGFDLRKDIVSALGDVVQIYESPREGGRLLTGWTGVIKVRDEAKLKKVEQRFRQLTENPRAPFYIKSRKYRGETVSYLVFRDDAPGFTPAWCFSKGRLIVAAYPQCIYGLLSRPPMPPAKKIVRAIDEQEASVFLRVREDRVAEHLYPFVWIVASMINGKLNDEFDQKIELDPGVLPSLPAIADHLGDATVSVDLTDGLEVVRHQTLPPTGVSLVAMVAAVGEVFDRANRFDDVAAPPIAMSKTATEVPGNDMTAAKTNQDKAREKTIALEQAQALADKGKQQEAIDMLLKLSAEESDGDIAARYQLGSVYYNLRQHAKAMEVFEECVEDAPDDFRGYLGRGKTAWIQDKNEESIPDFRKATALNADSYDAWLYLGLANRSLNNTAESIVYLSKSIALNPEQWYALNSRGNSYYDSDDFKRAIADYTKSLELRKTNNRSLYWRAQAFRRIGEWDSAIADTTRLLQANPLDEDALISRADMYEEINKNDFAIRDYNSVIGLNPKNAKALKERGGVWMDLEQYDEAITDYTRALELAPDQWTYANRAICWKTKDESEKVISDYSSALKLDPKYKYGLKQRALAYSGSGQFAKAKADYLAALNVDDEHDEYLLGNFSWLLAAAPEESVRDGKLALDYATKACEMTDWKEAWIIDNVAAAHAEMGDFTKAIEFAQRAVDAAESDSVRSSVQSRLSLYKQNKPAIWE